MKLAFKQFYVYVRTAVVLFVAAAIALVLFKNRHHQVAFWFFGLIDETKPINVVILVWFTAGTTLLVARIATLTVRLWKDWRSLREIKVQTEKTKLQKLREADLQVRERLVEEKLKSMEKQEGLDRPGSPDRGP